MAKEISEQELKARMAWMARIHARNEKIKARWEKWKSKSYQTLCKNPKIAADINATYERIEAARQARASVHG